jgi:hypothetical protein
MRHRPLLHRLCHHPTLNCRINVMIRQAILSVTHPQEGVQQREQRTGTVHAWSELQCASRRDPLSTCRLLASDSIPRCTGEEASSPFTSPAARARVRRWHDEMAIWQSLHFAVHVCKYESGSHAAARASPVLTRDNPLRTKAKSDNSTNNTSPYQMLQISEKS